MLDGILSNIALSLAQEAQGCIGQGGKQRPVQVGRVGFLRQKKHRVGFLSVLLNGGL